MVTVWRLRGLREPVPVPAQVKQCEVSAWAIFTDGTRGRIGSTVFLAEQPARQRWQGELDRLRKSGYHKAHFPSVVERADELCEVNVYRGQRPWKKKLP